MLDIVFSESAAGTLRYAQGLGRGPYRPGGVGFLFEDGKQPSRLRLWWMRRQYHKKEKAKWEQAVVLEGRREDIICISLSLSIGRPDCREAVLWDLARYDVLPEQEEADRQAIRDRLDQVEKNLDVLCARAKNGEALRIWLGTSAEDSCMMAWFAHQLVSRDLGTARIFLNRLPDRYVRPDGSMISWTIWGEVEPLLWGRLDQELHREAPTDFLTEEAQLWQTLCKENGELRILENGRLKSVPADYYDSRIQAEIDRQPPEFIEAQVIGSLIGQGLLMPDTWIANRIELLIQEGQLAIAKEEAPGVPSYRRTLRKTAV